MLELLKKSPLFASMSAEEVKACLGCSRAEIVTCEKDAFLFRQGDIPRKLMVLVEGVVAVGNDSSAGKRSIIATFDQPGELFGEVFLFLNKGEYDHYAQALTPARVLQIPKEFLYHTCGEDCAHHRTMISNMLSILARKAYFLNQRLQIVSCATLRQKIAKVLLQNRAPDGRVSLPMNREELADFLNTARPSLSRELMRMQEEGLVTVDRRTILVPDEEALRELL